MDRSKTTMKPKEISLNIDREWLKTAVNGRTGDVFTLERRENNLVESITIKSTFGLSRGSDCSVTLSRRQQEPEETDDGTA